jgi:uncharacterized protein (TIGR03643 family)
MVFRDSDRIVEMAWEDRTPFDAIEAQFGMNEAVVITFMRKELSCSSYKRWRRRVSGRRTKHRGLRNPLISRAHCPSQYKPKARKRFSRPR